MSPPLIVIVDDDPALLETTAAALRAAYAVRAFSSAAEALDALGSAVPDAIVSDIVMPGLGGFEFRRVYQKRFDARRTPFLFLTSLADPDTVVAGLDAGADDVIIKPVVPEVLRARIRALLRRRVLGPTTAYRGDLARLPFPALLQLCEAKGVTGELVIEAKDLRVVLPIRGGALDEEAATPWIDRLCDLTEGAFLLRSTAADLRDLDQPPAPEPEGPVGRFSAISVRGRTLRVQTELVQGDLPVAVTLVLAGDEPLAKLRRPIPEGADARAVQELLDAQHAEAEAQTRDRLSAIRQQWQHGTRPPETDAPPTPVSPTLAPAAPAPKAAPAPIVVEDAARATQLFDEGYEHYRRRDWAGALASWERARALDPKSRTIAINIEVAKKKLAAADGT